jgi:hypothetical protein
LERRSTGRSRLREEVAGDPTVAVHGGGGSAVGGGEEVVLGRR